MTFTPIIGRDYITRDGRKATIIGRDGIAKWPYSVECEESEYTVSSTGRQAYDQSKKLDSDLVGFWPSEQYGPWTAYNGGGCPVEDGVRGQVQMREERQVDAEKDKPADLLGYYDWELDRTNPIAICAYRVLKEPVHEAVMDDCLQWDSSQAEVFCTPAKEPHEHGFSLTVHHIDGEPDKSRPPEAKWT